MLKIVVAVVGNWQTIGQKGCAMVVEVAWGCERDLVASPVDGSLIECLRSMITVEKGHISR